MKLILGSMPYTRTETLLLNGFRTDTLREAHRAVEQRIFHSSFFVVRVVHSGTLND